MQVWIDFNDDSNFTNDEVVVPNFVIAPGSAGGSYTETVDLVIPAGAAVGEHRMRAKSNWQAPVSSDPCEESSFGETEDYTANIGVLGLSDIAINNSDMVVSSTDNKQFEVLLTTSLDETIYAGIYNMLGQQLSVKTTNRNDDNGGTLGSTTSKSERIIVK